MSDNKLEVGERFAKSAFTREYYRVTVWYDIDDSKFRSGDGEKVERENVPDEWLEALDNE